MKFALIVAIALTALACGPGRVPTSGDQQAQPQAGAAQPKSGGYLRHLLPYSPQNLDPYTTEEPTGYGFIVRQWFDPLISHEFEPGVDWRITSKVVPWLAESWKQDDPKTFTFQLRKGVKFHDGADFTAKDVVASYKRFSDPNEKISPQIRLQVEQLEGASLLDEYTVRVTAKRPDPDFLANISDARIPMLSSKFIESGGDLTKQVVGTGPFKVQSYRKDAEGVAGRLAGVQVNIERQVGEGDKLFGSVNTRDIEEALAAQGIKVEKRQIHLPEPLKALGQYTVDVKLSRGVTAQVKVWVVAKS